MAAGSISRLQFNEEIRAFARYSASLNDDWNIRDDFEKDGDEEKVIFLEKTLITQDFHKPELEEQHDEVCSDEIEEDSVSLPANETGHMKCIYHIVYSQSYQVPVLYFNIFKQDGKLLSLEEVWKSIPANYQERVDIDKWTFLTQQEHPLLGRPFYHLHPCHTATLMANCPHKPRNYVVTWLSVVGPVVGLKVPLEYGKLDAG